MPFRTTLCLLCLSCLATACVARTASSPSGPPTYDPFVPLQGSAVPSGGTASSVPTRTAGPTPTLAPLSVLVPTRNPGRLLATPTPDRIHALPTPRQKSKQYTVQAGDTLGSIAESFGVSAESLQQANGISDANLLSVGQTLEVPAPQPGEVGPAFKIIPDSELVYGPAAAQFDVSAYIQGEGGYLANYSENVNGDTLEAAQVITLVAQNYSVNPRLLLALLEYRSRWVTDAAPNASTLEYPLAFLEPNHTGLYRQLTWASNEFNRGFYLWRAGAIGHWVLHDNSIVPIDPTINPGTAGVQNFFSILDDRETWTTDVTAFGLFQTYFLMFGNPFDLAIEPLVPASLSQPRLILPFDPGAVWAFTGGPHAAWDSGSAWGALDFAPADVLGCAISQQWVTAMADGFIVRAANGSVIEDLDGDGYEQTGWDILYMHVADQDRVQPLTYVYAGDRIGHPSCEGGIANAAHLHLTRKYNGEWISADGILPFVMDGWTSSGTGTEYDGFLARGSIILEAFEGINASNQITR
jgi:LasA protease